MAKQRLRQVNSTNYVHKKKRNLQQYFDNNPTEILTPNHRSLPKKKCLFNNNVNNRSKGKISKQQQLKELNSRRNSNQKKKIQFSPQFKKEKKITQKDHHYKSRFEHSNQRQYDSPSRDQQEMDFILAGRPKKGKGNSYVEETIDRINQNLKKNQLHQAIETLNSTLRQHPNNYDLNYLLGICHLINSAFQQAINVFDNLLKTQPRKNIYLLLSVCYKKIDDFEQTQQILDECLRKYPKYYEAYIYRGKLNLKTKNYKRALYDFQKAISLDPQKQIGFIGKGDCLRLMEKYEDAKSIYAKALLYKTNNQSVLLRRAICNIELKRYEIALEDILKLLQSDPINSQALYFKGLILNKLKKQNDALICYEQAIKHNTNKKAVTRALYEITKIKIQNRDYYEALYTLERAEYLDIDQKVIKKFKIFIEGVTSMMKKNYAQGIKVLTELLNNQNGQKPISNFLKPLFYSTRSYGYMNLQKFPQALEDLQNMQRQFSLDLPNLYNKFICQGIMSCNSMRYEQALAQFSKAGKAQPHRIQPNFYKAVTLICFAHKLLPKDLKQKKMEYIESAMKTLSKNTHPIQNNPSLFLVRGFLQYALGNLEKALQDFQCCLNQSIKPNPLVFYLNGLVLAQAQKYQDAVHQFKKAIQGDDKHQMPDIFLSRARCMILMEEVNNGFQDLQSYMAYKSNSPDIHVWAGHLLFHIGACQDAAKAYSNISNISKNPQVLLHRAECYLTSKDVISTITNLKMILDLKYSNQVYFDSQMLEALKQCSQDNIQDYGLILARMKQAKQKISSIGENKVKFGKFFTQIQYQFYKGLMYFYDNKYEQASKNFRRSLDLYEKKIQKQVAKDQSILSFYKINYHNKSYSYFEIQYNIAVSQLMLGNLAKASRIIKEEIIKKIDRDGGEGGKIRNDLELLVNLISREMVNSFDRKNVGKQRKQLDDNQEYAEFFPFLSDNRLCSIFPDIILPFSTPIKTRLYFCLPFVQKPDISIKFDDKILEQFSMNTIQIKPQAPWIRRSQQGVIFTDEVVRYDIQLSESSSSQKNQQSQQEGDFNQEQQGQIQGYQMYEHDERNIPEVRDNSDHGRYHMNGNFSQQEEQQQIKPVNASKLRQMFKLDPATEARLAKMNKKNQRD